jgi:carbonic anhydrase
MFQFFNLASTPQIAALAIRNAGGSARKALSDILAIDSLVSFTDIVVVRHTDCGSGLFRDEAIKAGIRARLPSSSADDADLQAEIENFHSGECTTSPAEMCRDEVEWLKAHPFLRDELKTKVWGGVFNIETGKVDAVA